jgi:Na+/H+-dicarboxylate symporter
MYQLLFGKKYLPYRVAIAFILGVIVGSFYYDFSVWVKPAGTLFMNLIKMLIVPVIFFSLTSGIAAIGDVNKLKRIGSKVVLVYVVMTVVACLIGIFVVNIFHPGANFDTSTLSAFDPSKLKTISFSAFLFNMVPTNIVSAMAKQDILQMIFFTVLFAIALVYIGEKGRLVVQVCETCAQVIYKMLDIVMIYSPVGVFALMANTTAVYGKQLFGALAKFVITDYVGCFLIWAVLSGITYLYTKIDYFRMCKAMVPIWINTIATNSSAGTIPITLNVTTEKLKVPMSIAGFSIPLGATINLTGAALYKTILAFFVAEIYGLQLTPSQIVMVITISTIMSIAAPGIPGGGIITGAIFLNLMGLPMDMMGPITGMYRLIDMSHTTVNVSGDVLGTLLVAKNEHIWNRDMFTEDVKK